MPLTRRQVYRRRRIVVGTAAAIALGVAFYLPITLLAPLSEADAVVAAVAEHVVTQPPVTFPGYGASAVGAVGYPGVLASAGSPDPLPIASIAKVVTALVVLDAHPLAPTEPGPEITFGPQDEQFYSDLLAAGGVVADVSSGQVMSQRTVMDIMLMTSANNYAESLATWAFGSIDAYVGAANAWLAAEGLTGTVITEPTGIEPSNVSTAANLVEIARRVTESPVLAEIVATPSTDVPVLGTIENRNELLGIDGIDGIKTGTLDEAGACLLFSSDYAVGSTVITIVGVVLGGPDHDSINNSIRSLLQQVGAGFTEVALVAAGQPFASYETAWGDTADAVAAESASVAVWAATPITLAVDARGVTLGDAGAPVGQLTFTVGDRTITIPLQLSATIDDPGPWWRLTNPDKLF